MVKVDKMVDEILPSEATRVVIALNHSLDRGSNFVHSFINERTYFWGGRIWGGKSENVF